jgi:DNA-directed RNA polymerase subunit RPC12/RpoP
MEKYQRTCQKCGERRTSKAIMICLSCRHNFNEPFPKIEEEKKLKCPKCSSEQLTSDKKGYGLGKAVVGGLLTGGVGLLAGFIGSRKVKITCLKCGTNWTAGEMWKENFNN